jgi:malate permease and related proteins
VPIFDVSGLQDALEPFVALIALVLIGMWIKHRGIITERGQAELTRFILDIGLPALVFASMASGMTSEMLLQTPLVIGAVVIIVLLGYALARLVTRYLRAGEEQKRVLEMEAAFPNTGFLGIPVNAYLFGPAGAFVAVLCDIGVTLMMYGFPAWILDRKRASEAKLSMVVNGITIAFVLGLIPSLTGWTVPAVVLQPINMLGDMSIPLGLLLVGIMAIPLEVEHEHATVIALVTGLRLIVVPLIVYGAVQALGVAEPIASVMVLESAMPAFAGGPILAQKHGGDYRLAASATVVSTLNSTLTLPLLAMLLMA